MNPEFSTILDHQISYYQSKGKSQPIVFVHGNSLSARTWENQFNSELGDKYHLVALDLPGHGLSDQAKDPPVMYSVPFFNRILIEFVRLQKIQDAVFIGHSLGGHMLLDAYSGLEPYSKGYVIFGTPPLQPDHPMERSHFPNPSFALAFKGDLTDEEINRLAEMYVNKGVSISDIILKDILRTDPRMRDCLGPNSTPDKFMDETAVIANMKQPIAILHGEGDQTIRASYFDELPIPTLWKGEVQLIHESGHCPQVENPTVFNKLLAEFLAAIYS